VRIRAGMAQTMEDFKMPPATWSDDLRSYEREKRRVIDEGLVQGQQMRLPYGHVRAQERTFDPLLQRFRDNGMETKQRQAEDRERIAHLNRAQDTQITHEQPFHILHHESRLNALAPGVDPARLAGGRGGSLGKMNRTSAATTGFPTTSLDHNIITNLPFEEHHWAPPGERPSMAEKAPRERKVPQWQIKDFNIISNRYVSDHEAKRQAENRVNLVEAAQKYNKQNCFDPLTQQFSDPRVEARVRAGQDAREVEAVVRAQAQVPPSLRARESVHYDVLSHKAHDEDMLQAFDSVQELCKERYKNRYIYEHNLHAQDLKGDHITEARKLNRVAPERFEWDRQRGYDIIENRAFGHGSKEKKIHEPFTQPRLTPWEKIEAPRHAEAGTLAASSSAPQLRPAPSGFDATGRPPALSPAGSGSASPAAAMSYAAASRGQPAALRRVESSAGGLSMGPTPRPLPPGRTGPPAAMMAVAPPAPTIPGSPVGSVFSRKRA